MAALLIAAAAGTVIWVNAGDLNPPAGPVAPTMKPLDEVEPRIAINAINTPGDADSVFRISSPGSYYLASDINGSSAKHGIEIASSGVSIDLMGFRVTGVGGSLRGITTSDTTNRSGLSITNGHVRFWGQSGILLNGDNHRLDRIGAQSNGLDGLGVGTNSVVVQCTASSNSGNGFYTGSCAVLQSCSARLNGGSGVRTGDGSAVRGCAAEQNTGNGFTLSNDNAVEGCSAHANGGTGIQAGPDCTVTGCTSSLNGNNGIGSNNYSKISGCATSRNDGNGISVAGGCVVIGCSAAFNGFNGNGAGIQADFSDNRIEGNNCTGNDRGIEIAIAGNIIVRNTCSGNTINWDIAANNVVGPILDRSAPGSAAINGNSAPDSTGSAHPNANFTY